MSEEIGPFGALGLVPWTGSLLFAELPSQILERRQGDILRGPRMGLTKRGEEALGFSLANDMC